MPLTCSASAAGTRVSVDTSGFSEAPVTVISDGKVVTDPTVVAAAASSYGSSGGNAVTVADTGSTGNEGTNGNSNTNGNANGGDANAHGDVSGNNNTKDNNAGDGSTGDAGDGAGNGSDGSSDGTGSSDGADGTDGANGQNSSAQGDERNNDQDAAAQDDAAQPQAATSALGGRDYEGQVTKTINGKTFILIGNEQQLRAIGSDKKVVGRIVKVTQTCTHLGLAQYGWKDNEGSESVEYAGDADLAADGTLREEAGNDHDGALTCLTGINEGKTRTKYYALDDAGNHTDVDKAVTTYTNDANYIIFRDIDLSSANWTPLMFSGTMLGAVSADTATAGTLWSTLGTDGASVNGGVAKPVISNVTVRQTGKINHQKQSGVGFFATVSSPTGIAADGSKLTSAGATTVDNLRLEHVDVSNTATETEDTATLVGVLFKVLSGLLSGIGGIVDWATHLLPGVNTNLKGLLTDLLTLRAKDPTLFATGAFAGRVDGQVRISDCEVADAKVSNVKGMTGGFVGYSTGETEYDLLSDALGGIVDVLGKVLNSIPGLGVGDLVTWLLNGNLLTVSELIPIGYHNPVISNSSVDGFSKGTVIGNDDSSYAGGFVGAQIGTIIENSSVTSANAFTVKAKDYAGGFAGVTRNGDVGGLVKSLGIDLLSALRPQSLIEGSTLNATGGVTVTAEHYAGGFAGAMANAYAVNDAMTGSADVTATTSGKENDTAGYAGGFTGYASVGWGLEIGTDDATDTSLVKNLVTLITNLTSDAEGGMLLSVAGVNPSAILGADMRASITVTSKGDYAGGIAGAGSGTMIADSSEANLNTLSYWKYDTTLHPRRAYPASRSTTLDGLAKVNAAGSYAGGIAGTLQPVMVAGLLNSVLTVGDTSILKKVNEFASFLVQNVTLTGGKDGLAVTAGTNYAGGAIGCATGGDVTGVALTNLGKVSAKAEAGGFIGFSGPGKAVGASSLDVLGLIKLSGLLSVAEYSSVDVRTASVTGVDAGFTVAATGVSEGSDPGTYPAGGFYGQANSTDTADAHVTGLKSVTAESSKTGGMAGGFVGYSTVGGLAEALNGSGGSNVISILKVDNLLGAVPYLIPHYIYTDVKYVDGGFVEADKAGGFAGTFQSGRVNSLTDKEQEDAALVGFVDQAKADPFAVVNIDHVTGGAYAGGFAGQVVSGALASAGEGGLSVLGKLNGVSVANILSLAQAYVPFVVYAGVHSDATTVTGTADGNADYGLLVTARRLDSGDAESGSAGGFAGYVSAAQISSSSVTQLRRTDVKAPSDLETTDTTQIANTYLNDQASKYAVDGARYAGGYIGKIDIGSTAAVADSISLLGGAIDLSDLLSALDVIVSTVERSDVTGGIGGYSVRASDTSDKDNPLGMAGGFVGDIEGGHIQQSDAHEFVYIIGQISAGGYVGTMQPGAVANVLKDADVVKRIANVDNLLSLVQDFVPTIRNSSTDAAICGGAVRAQATSGEKTRRGMAGGYVGHNRGGHIWGMDTRDWSSIRGKDVDKPTPETAYASRIRSVYGQEIAGGYTGFMEAADTADGGSISLLSGLVEVNDVLGALELVYPTEEHTKVDGPLRNASIDQWDAWVNNTGKYGAYGKEFDEVLQNRKSDIDTQEKLDAYLAGYVYGFNVVAGRDGYKADAHLRDSGVAGGHVGIMRTGTITDGQSWDVRTVSAMRSAGGYAGTMESGSAARFGSVSLLGLGVDLGSLVTTPQVFVPVIKSSSVTGYRKGMKVEATGVNITNGTGNAGGYVGMAVGGQIWGDRDSNGNALDAEKNPDAIAAGADVDNLRKVSGHNNVGGYVGIATSGATAGVDTNDTTDGILGDLIGGLVGDHSGTAANPAGLISVLQATVTTIRGAHVSADSSEWGYTVEGGAYQATDGTTAYALNAGGFAGSLQAAILGDRDSAKGTGTGVDTAKNDPSEVTVTGLRGVEGGQYAGGFVGLADISSVASVGGGEMGDNDKQQVTDLLFKLLKVGNVGVLEAFRTFIYDGRVDGVADGIQVKARTATRKGMLDSTRFTGSAGGFAGGVINGSVKQSKVTNLNSVEGVNNAGGFVGHLGKSGTVSADKTQIGDDLFNVLGLTAGVLEIWGSHVDGSSVTGITAGYTVDATHGTSDYGKGTETATGREVAGGFAGLADLARVKDCTADALKKVTSGEIAGGFVGETKRAYLVDVEANSLLVGVLLEVVDALVKLLYVDKAQGLGVINLGKWFPNIGKVFDLKVLADGDVLYVNLFGLKIGVSLAQPDQDNSSRSDVARVTIGDSVIELPCSKDGIDKNAAKKNLSIQLIKGNRTRVEASTATGITDGYDVFGGGATQDSDGTEGLATGYAGGFAGLNDEGVLAKDAMVRADVVRGTSGLVDPFSYTLLKTAWSFNSMSDIVGPVQEKGADGRNENRYNTYRVYRSADGNRTEAKTKDGDRIAVGVADADTGLDAYTVELFKTVNTYDGDHANSQAAGDDKTKWVGIKGAVRSGVGVADEQLKAYDTAAKAVLMLDKAVSGNNGGVTPEPDDGQDPCGKNGCKTVDLTLQKVWRNGQLERPDTITLQVTATYTDANGEQQTVKELECFKDDCTTEKRDNPFTVTMTAKNDGSAWSDTWRTKLTGLPVAFVDKGSGPNGEDVTRYYTYTVKELNMTFADGGADGKAVTKTPAEAGYSVSVKYGKDKDGKYVATVTNFSPLPETGGNGTLMFVMFGVLMLALGTAWYLRVNRMEPATAGGVGTALPFGGRRGRHTR
ncbi:LPXTG cell wall anchor domain-containing protein [Bifidobacterium sp. SMA15]|uniref:LPXTG cell wall anchor domain-containing protein n=2 Tax=Bifidobacterium platyrrhinorum TaxID=2661628 RepID=A0A6L9SX33_9BIFI|nr:LPXTG cell wall anchor domain-containing protein [Bifidobacterium platyrrhinorum]